MRIAEIFHSIQGEGMLAGMPSVFVRTSGCNLRCTWCDTPYASWEPEGNELSAEQVASEVFRHAPPHALTYIVLTGGEPMMLKELPALIALLKTRPTHITVETAGTLWLEGIPEGGIDLASISPKLANSTPWQREQGRFAQAHEAHRLNLDVLRRFAAHGAGAVKYCQWKFVLSQPEDLDEIESLIAQLNGSLPVASKIQPDQILLMPEGTDEQTLTLRSRQLAEICLRKSYRLSPRLQIPLYGNTRGT